MPSFFIRSFPQFSLRELIDKYAHAGNLSNHFVRDICIIASDSTSEAEEALEFLTNHLLNSEDQGQRYIAYIFLVECHRSDMWMSEVLENFRAEERNTSIVLHDSKPG